MGPSEVASVDYKMFAIPVVEKRDRKTANSIIEFDCFNWKISCPPVQQRKPCGLSDKWICFKNRSQ